MASRRCALITPLSIFLCSLPELEYFRFTPYSQKSELCPFEAQSMPLCLCSCRHPAGFVALRSPTRTEFPSALHALPR